MRLTRDVVAASQRFTLQCGPNEPPAEDSLMLRTALMAVSALALVAGACNTNYEDSEWYNDSNYAYYDMECNAYGCFFWRRGVLRGVPVRLHASVPQGTYLRHRAELSAGSR